VAERQVPAWAAAVYLQLDHPLVEDVLRPVAHLEMQVGEVAAVYRLQVSDLVLLASLSPCNLPSPG